MALPDPKTLAKKPLTLGTAFLKLPSLLERCCAHWNENMARREADPKEDFKGIDAVDRALAVLESFSAQRPELGVTELSRELHLHKSTTFRSLASLEARGFVTKDDRTQRYTLGPKILRLSAAYLNSIDVRDKARPIMQRLRMRTKETVSLWIPAGDRCVCIERMESSHEVRRVINMGDHIPLYGGSPGKVILAYMPEANLAEVMSRVPPEPSMRWAESDPEAFEAQLALVRERRFAISDGDGARDGSSVSAPVFNAAGEVVAALTVSGPTSRFDGDQANQHARLVKQAAAEVSMQMGYGMYLDGSIR